MPCRFRRIERTPINDLAASLLIATAFSDAYGCLCLVQRMAANGKRRDDEQLLQLLEQIEVTVSEAVANLRLKQGEIESCAR